MDLFSKYSIESLEDDIDYLTKALLVEDVKNSRLEKRVDDLEQQIKLINHNMEGEELKELKKLIDGLKDL